MSVKFITSNQPSEIHLKNVTQSRRSIFETAKTLYESRKKEFSAKEKELNQYHENLAKRVTEIGQDRIAPREEGVFDAITVKQFEMTLEEIQKQTVLFHHLEEAFDGLSPMHAQNLPFSENTPSGSEDSLSRRQVKAIKKGLLNIGTYKSLTDTMHMQMTDKLKQVKSFIRQLQHQSGLPVSSSSSMVSHQSELLTIKRLEEDYLDGGSSTTTLEDGWLDVSSDVRKFSLYDQMPDEYFSSSAGSSSSSTTSMDLTRLSPSRDFSVSDEVTREVDLRLNFYEDMRDREGVENGTEGSFSGSIVRAKTDLEDGLTNEDPRSPSRKLQLTHFEIQQKLVEKAVSGIEHQIDELAKTERRISHTKSELRKMNLTRINTDHTTINTIENEIETIPVTTNDRVQSKTRTPPKMPQASVVSMEDSLQTPKVTPRQFLSDATTLQSTLLSRESSIGNRPQPGKIPETSEEDTNPVPKSAPTNSSTNLGVPKSNIKIKSRSYESLTRTSQKPDRSCSLSWDCFVNCLGSRKKPERLITLDDLSFDHKTKTRSESVTDLDQQWKKQRERGQWK